jgi:arginine:ornithine antiporter/lysine permease
VRPAERRRDLIISIIATAYTIFLLYAGGLTFILLSAVLYAPGTALYIWARREQGKAVFTRPWDWALFGLAVIGAVVGIHGLATGYIQI